MKSSKTIMGVDIAKRVFQLYWVDQDTGGEHNMRLSRAKFLRHFANHVPCLVVMEARGGTQHWARQLQGLGHGVRILPAQRVSPFVPGNNNDAHDARAQGNHERSLASGPKPVSEDGALMGIVDLSDARVAALAALLWTRNEAIFARHFSCQCTTSGLAPTGCATSTAAASSILSALSEQV